MVIEKCPKCGQIIDYFDTFSTHGKQCRSCKWKEEIDNFTGKEYRPLPCGEYTITVNGDVYFQQNHYTALNETDEEMEQKGWEILKENGIDKEHFHISQLKNVDFESMNYLSKKAVAIATKTNIFY